MIAKMFAVESPNPPDVDEALKQYILSVVNTNSNNPVVQPAVVSTTTAVTPLITSILRAKLAANKWQPQAGIHPSYKKYPSPTHVTPNAHVLYAISQAKGSVVGFNNNTVLHTDHNITD